jgi:hypothetical protein
MSSIPPKPKILTNFEQIPNELKKLNQWVLFRLKWNEKSQKWTKVPYQVNGHPASIANPSQWTDFQTARIYLENLELCDGIGFVFTENDGYCGIDLDKCVDPATKTIQPWALEIIGEFKGTYIEFTPSGTGLHIIARAALPGRGRKRLDIEIYDRERYFTMTGHIYENCAIADKHEEVLGLLKRVFKHTEANNLDFQEPLKWSELPSAEAQDLIRRASNAANGKKFASLFKGRWQHLYGSQSEAELAFCEILAFWTKCNEVAIDQIMRQSALYRSKWERFDYRSRTIRKAITHLIKTNPEPSVSSTGAKPLPLVHISEIKAKPVEYLVQDLLPLDSVGFISAQPGTCKTWMAWELGLSVATGTLAFGSFQARQGKVVAFNAEDDPAMLTRHRINGLAAFKGIELKRADFHLFDVPALRIDDATTQSALRMTVQMHKPALVVLDPLRNLHQQEENDSTQMAPILDFLRSLNREFHTSILLVCHDKKPGRSELQRRESQTRGSNAVEGWRDFAFYLDREKQQKNVTQVTSYHRGARSLDPFFVELDVTSAGEPGKEEIETASILKVNAQEVLVRRESEIENEIRKALTVSGPKTRDELEKLLRKRKKEVLNTVRSMITNGELEDFYTRPVRGANH